MKRKEIMAKEMALKKLDKIFDVWIERLDAMKDFIFVGALKYVTLTEIMMLWLVILIFFWLILFDVQHSSLTFQYIWNEPIWIIIFGVLIWLHIFGILMNSQKTRIITAHCYSFLWFTWVCLAGWGNFGSPSVPIFFVLLMTSIILTIRITRSDDKI
jgi:peptidoglycan/LPS O-acetylase OafA/YrhL